MRPKCVVCDEDQTDVIFIGASGPINNSPGDGLMYIGFPVCDNHTLADLKPDQYVMNNLIVEVH